MAKIIGIRDSSFEGKDGSEVNGTNFYLTYPLEKGTGDGCERIFMTDEKLHNGDFIPQIGDEVSLEYNRYGKVAAIRRASES